VGTTPLAGNPPSTWQGVPVMPKAFDYQADEFTCEYSIKATAGQVEAFYNQGMSNLGWDSIEVSDAPPGNTVLVYKKGNLATMISFVAQGDLILLLIMQR
jgi:hypothetical protein